MKIIFDILSHVLSYSLFQVIFQSSDIKLIFAETADIFILSSKNLKDSSKYVSITISSESIGEIYNELSEI